MLCAGVALPLSPSISPKHIGSAPGTKRKAPDASRISESRETQDDEDPIYDEDEVRAQTGCHYIKYCMTKCVLHYTLLDV